MAPFGDHLVVLLLGHISGINVFAVHSHGSKFIDSKGDTISSVPLLFKDDGSTGGEFDQGRADKH